MNELPFHGADILLPRVPTDVWPVVACDQYTSEPEYWTETEKTVGTAPSALRLILPEVYLNGNVTERVEQINAAMADYLKNNVFTEYPDAMIYLERTLADGRVRRGLIGAIDLDAYEYEAGKKPPIRSTEGTVLSRIPPRVAIRKDAPLELPHVMLLCDDPLRTVIEPLAGAKERMRRVYDLTLMQNGGRVAGWLLDAEARADVDAALKALKTAREKENGTPMLFAVGDGNHSLATAKTCAAMSDDPAAQCALVELVNIHDSALDFEPIYRVLTGTDLTALREALDAAFPRVPYEGSSPVTVVTGEEETAYYVSGLTSGAVQEFIDAYLKEHSGEVDYIHGEEVTRRLAQAEGAAGFLFDGISKAELFPWVEKNGALPRKTFSMGEAHDKRYYMEARRIRTHVRAYPGIRRILSFVRRAVDDYAMIGEGDVIAVGISGGKDSLTMLTALRELQRFYPKRFELKALAVSLFPEADYSEIGTFCDKLGVPLTVVRTEIGHVVFDTRKEKNPCSLCARMRRGALHDAAKELGCNKLALGHHFDDTVETFMLNLVHEGRLASFLPVTWLSRKQLTVIRPLLYVREKDVRYFVGKTPLPVLKNPCPADGETEREAMKQLLTSLEKQYKGVKHRIFDAMRKEGLFERTEEDAEEET